MRPLCAAATAVEPCGRRQWAQSTILTNNWVCIPNDEALRVWEHTKTLADRHRTLWLSIKASGERPNFRKYMHVWHRLSRSAPWKSLKTIGDDRLPIIQRVPLVNSDCGGHCGRVLIFLNVSAKRPHCEASVCGRTRRKVCPDRPLHCGR